jgi:hypothetical protein
VNPFGPLNELPSWLSPSTPGGYLPPEGTAPGYAQSATPGSSPSLQCLFPVSLGPFGTHCPDNILFFGIGVVIILLGLVGVLL